MKEYIDFGKSLGFTDVEIEEVEPDYYEITGRIGDNEPWTIYVASKEKIKWAIITIWDFAVMRVEK